MWRSAVLTEGSYFGSGGESESGFKFSVYELKIAKFKLLFYVMRFIIFDCHWCRCLTRESKPISSYPFLPLLKPGIALQPECTVYGLNLCDNLGPGMVVTPWWGFNYFLASSFTSGSRIMTR